MQPGFLCKLVLISCTLCYSLLDHVDPPRLPALKALLEFAKKKGHFIFDGEYYDQVDVVAMGSPLDPVLANIFIMFYVPSRGAMGE